MSELTLDNLYSAIDGLRERKRAVDAALVPRSADGTRPGEAELQAHISATVARMLRPYERRVPSWADVAALELRSAITTGRRMTWMKGVHDGWRQTHRAHATLCTVQAALEHYTITPETGP